MCGNTCTSAVISIDSVVTVTSVAVYFKHIVYLFIYFPGTYKWVQTLLLSGPFRRHLNSFVIFPAIWWSAELWVRDAAEAVWAYLTVDLVEQWYLCLYFVWKIPHCFFFSFWVAEATWPVAKTEILGSYYLDPDPSMAMPCNFTVPQLHFLWEQRQWHPNIALRLK